MTTDDIWTRRRGSLQRTLRRRGVRAAIVLEDDADLRSTLVELLEEDGYVVLATGDVDAWRASLEHARTSRRLDVRFHIIDLTLIDVAVLDELRAHDWRQPIIAVAADGCLHLDAIDAAGNRARFDNLPPNELLDLIARISTN